MKLFGILLSLAGCAGPSNELDLERDTKGPLDPGQNFVVVLHDQLGNGYELASATYHLDGRRIFHRANERGWSDLPDEVRVYRGYIHAGSHTLTMLLEYQPNDLGIFTYARGYKLRIKSGTDFETHPDEPTAVHAVITEQGGLSAHVDQRPEIRYYVTRPAQPREGAAVAAAGGE